MKKQAGDQHRQMQKIILAEFWPQQMSIRVKERHRNQETSQLFNSLFLLQRKGEVCNLVVNEGGNGEHGEKKISEISGK